MKLSHASSQRTETAQTPFKVGQTCLLILDLPNLDGQHFLDGLADHNGQEVVITDQGRYSFTVRAADGWEGAAYPDELKEVGSA